VFAEPVESAVITAALGLADALPYPVGNAMVTKAIEYTKKEETRIVDANGAPMWREVGVVEQNQLRKGDRHRVILDMVKSGATVEDIIEHDPTIGLMHLGNVERLINIKQRPTDRDELQVYYIFGETGVGKSHFVRRGLELNGASIYNKPHPKGNNTDFWMGYNGEEVVLFDDFHPNRYPLTDMLLYLQQYAMTLPVKGGHCAARYTKVFITTNVPISLWYQKEQCSPLHEGNYKALMRRIPPEHRMEMKVRPPTWLTPCSWERMKQYQDDQQATPAQQQLVVAHAQVKQPQSDNMAVLFQKFLEWQSMQQH
jgi:hypothetical protein